MLIVWAAFLAFFEFAFGFVSDFGLPLHASIRAPQQYSAKRLKNKIWEPDNEMWRKLRSGIQCFAKDDEAVVDGYQYQRHRNSDIGFPPMHADTQRNADQRKAKTGKRKRHLLMNLHTNDRGQILAVLSPLIFSDL